MMVNNGIFGGKMACETCLDLQLCGVCNATSNIGYLVPGDAPTPLPCLGSFSPALTYCRCLGHSTSLPQHAPSPCVLCQSADHVKRVHCKGKLMPHSKLPLLGCCLFAVKGNAVLAILGWAAQVAIAFSGSESEKV